MRTSILRGALIAATLMGCAATASAQPMRSKSIDVLYVAPKDAALKPVYDYVKSTRALEKMQDLLSALRLPRRLLIKADGCNGESNAWYEDSAVTICYEFLDEIWRNSSGKSTPAGIAAIDTVVGPFVDVVLHEVGHAVFDFWQTPLFGREEDAADQFSAYIVLQLGKDEARRLILGNAYQYKSDLQTGSVPVALKKFADVHGTPQQRFFNVLCLAYGADSKLFADIVESGFLPKDRSEGCEDEYKQVARAFNKLVRPYIDRKLYGRQLDQTWLPSIKAKVRKR